MQLPEINRDNVDSMDLFRDALVRDLEELARMTERYPVECQFGELRFVFTSREDIEHLISRLRGEIEAVRAAA